MVLVVATRSYLGSSIGLGEQWDQKISLPFVLGCLEKRQMGRRRNLYRHDGWGTCTKATKGGALRKLFKVFPLPVLPVYEVSYKNRITLGPRIFQTRPSSGFWYTSALGTWIAQAPLTFPQGVCLHHAAQKHPDNVALQNQEAQLFLQSSKHWMCTGAIQGWPILGSGLIIKWAKDIELHFCSRVYLEVPGVLLRMLRTIPSSTVKLPTCFSAENLPEESLSLASTRVICSRSSVGSQAPSCPAALCTADTKGWFCGPCGGVTHSAGLPCLSVEPSCKENRFQKCALFLRTHPGWCLILVSLSLLWRQPAKLGLGMYLPLCTGTASQGDDLRWRHLRCWWWGWNKPHAWREVVPRDLGAEHWEQ